MKQKPQEPVSPERFAELLAGSVAAHGHLCPGQVVGVRLALLGLRLLGFDAPPTLAQLKKLVVFVEMDRCAGDAVAFVANVRLGRRSLKYVDYGIMAATFVNLETGQAFRLISTEESRELAALYAPEEPDPRRAQLWAYQVMPDAALFRVQEVEVALSELDLPGPTRRKVACVHCGQVVRDGREILRDGRPYCRPCATGAYFTRAREISWADMDWAPYPRSAPDTLISPNLRQWSPARER